MLANALFRSVVTELAAFGEGQDQSTLATVIVLSTGCRLSSIWQCLPVRKGVSTVDGSSEPLDLTLAVLLDTRSSAISARYQLTITFVTRQEQPSDACIPCSFLACLAARLLYLCNRGDEGEPFLAIGCRSTVSDMEQVMSDTPMWLVTIVNQQIAPAGTPRCILEKRLAGAVVAHQALHSFDRRLQGLQDPFSILLDILPGLTKASVRETGQCGPEDSLFDLARQNLRKEVEFVPNRDPDCRHPDLRLAIAQCRDDSGGDCLSSHNMSIDIAIIVNLRLYHLLSLARLMSLNLLPTVVRNGLINGPGRRKSSPMRCWMPQVTLSEPEPYSMMISSHVESMRGRNG
ncbi:hypothetical protein J7T55_015492 [Diaporthe amygdali]|uniref:uncharacterized protein n=1 Tax=Phomopsis amygdali TaxID=1214568 RepID=UPI0022FF092A|nr:uncharacterized protein J7T55_015492 [Diaporthe amygdali]KAJ0120759.1 hypothetical protein J7T55_015492 [Diaporthe amygdali]